ncbi:hypothetical protein BC830DRAFT_1165770 [Chytriomyces sp. MP71]|nr:hypothetical protein BC830DRAFT_1165770 [Chytriomyces sp. MP71]
MLNGMAKAKGMSAFVGEGVNEWPSVHRVDAAVLYRPVMEDAFKDPNAEERPGSQEWNPHVLITTLKAPMKVVVHPLVLLPVVDHFFRVARNTSKRVVGVLRCQIVGDMFLHHDYQEAMHEMCKKVNALQRYVPNLVLVIIAVIPRDVGIPTDAYFAIEEDGTVTIKTFSHLFSSIEAEEAEEIGVEHLLRDIKDQIVGALSTQITDQFDSLKGLHNRLSDIRYLEKVVAGALHSFAVITNDELLVVYLSSLVRAVIALQQNYEPRWGEERS